MEELTEFFPPDTPVPALPDAVVPPPEVEEAGDAEEPELCDRCGGSGETLDFQTCSYCSGKGVRQ